MGLNAHSAQGEDEQLAFRRALLSALNYSLDLSWYELIKVMVGTAHDS